MYFNNIWFSLSFYFDQPRKSEVSDVFFFLTVVFFNLFESLNIFIGLNKIRYCRKCCRIYYVFRVKKLYSNSNIWILEAELFELLASYGEWREVEETQELEGKCEQTRRNIIIPRLDLDLFGNGTSQLRNQEKILTWNSCFRWWYSWIYHKEVLCT